MALISINGVELPAPSKYDVGIMDIVKMERNANGDMVGEIIATKRKIELEWKTLSNEELSQVYNLISDLFFSVNFIDPKDNGVRCGTFYKGDRKAGALYYHDGKIKWKNIGFNIIER